MDFHKSWEILQAHRCPHHRQQEEAPPALFGQEIDLECQHGTHSRAHNDQTHLHHNTGTDTETNTDGCTRMLRVKPEEDHEGKVGKNGDFLLGMVGKLKIDKDDVGKAVVKGINSADDYAGIQEENSSYPLYDDQNEKRNDNEETKKIQMEEQKIAPGTKRKRNVRSIDSSYYIDGSFYLPKQLMYVHGQDHTPIFFEHQLDKNLHPPTPFSLNNPLGFIEAITPERLYEITDLGYQYAEKLEQENAFQSIQKKC